MVAATSSSDRVLCARDRCRKHKGTKKNCVGRLTGGDPGVHVGGLPRAQDDGAVVEWESDASVLEGGCSVRVEVGGSCRR